MKKIFRIDSPVMVFLGRVWDLMVVNLLFLLLCIPIVTIGASTTALYRVLIDFQNGKDDNTVKRFWRAFLENLKPSLILFLILLIPVALLVYYLLYTFSGDTFAQDFFGIYLLAVVIVEMIWSYVWPLQAQFKNNVFNTLKNSVILAFGHFLRSFVMAVLNLAPIIHFLASPVSFLRYIVIWILLGFSVIAFVNNKIAFSVFRKYAPVDKDICATNEE